MKKVLQPQSLGYAYLERMCLICFEFIVFGVLYIDLFAADLARHLCVVVDECGSH